jgi:hypothetical protein
MKRRPPSARLTIIIAAFTAIMVTGTASPALAAPARHGGPPLPISRGDVAPPRPTRVPDRLAVKPGTVAVRPNLSPPVARPNLAAASPTDLVGLRALVIALDNDDFGLATWTSQLNQIGVPYDTLLARSTDLTAAQLLRADGGGRYNAILLSNNSLLFQDGSGNFVSGFTADEWNILWDYERTYHVRQATLYSSYGTFPEDYCLRAVSEGGIGDVAQNAVLTAAGAPVFDYLKASAQIPISLSYVYRNSIAAGCAATPLLTLGGNVVGVTTTSTDGRERAALTFSSNQFLTQTALLTYGLVRWATHGVFLGEQRHWINVDVDDWYNSTDEMLPNGVLNSDPGYRNTTADVTNLVASQNSLRSTFPLAAGFKVNMAYNSADGQTSALRLCLGSIVVPNTLSGYTYCNRNEFRWINHTYDHQALNFTDYPTTFNEISQNLTRGAQLGLTVPATVLKTPEYSGLGTYNPDPNDSINPPTDHGLGASNPAVLQASTAAGVKYLHGNMSFASQRPSCFNCGIYHPLAPNLLIVPDWPTNIWYFSTTPDEETYFYNRYYGPGGLFPFWPTNLTYPQIIDYESGVGLQHVMSGSAYSHTMHIGNVRRYAAGKTLAFDWLTAIVTKYSALYNVPLRNPQWTDLGQYAADRTAHFAAIPAGDDAVWDRSTNTVTITKPAAGTVFLTGAKVTGFDQYGTDPISKLTLTANTPLTTPVLPRP